MYLIKKWLQWRVVGMTVEKAESVLEWWGYELFIAFSDIPKDCLVRGATICIGVLNVKVENGVIVETIDWH